MPMQGGSEILGFDIQTEHMSNGTQTLIVTDGNGNNDSRTVTFQNVVSNLSYDGIFGAGTGDGAAPLTCHITADVAGGGSWSVEVRDRTNQVVKSLPGTGTSLDVTWDGTNAAGSAAQGGAFSLFFKPPSGTSVNAMSHGRARRRVTRRSSSRQSRTRYQAASGEPGDDSTIWIGITNNSRYPSDAFILLDTTAFTYPLELDASNPGNKAYCLEYADFIGEQVNKSLNIQHAQPLVVSPHLLQIDDDDGKGKRMAQIINRAFSRANKLVYVAAHGDFTQDSIHPFFGIGAFAWHSAPNQFTNSANPSVRDINFNVRALTYDLNYGGHGDEDNNSTDPPMLVWMDNCASAGAYDYGSKAPADPTQGDAAWAFAFGVDFINGQEGAFLGWNGWSITSGQQWAPEWAVWRGEVWRNLFSNGRNLASALQHADSAAEAFRGSVIFGNIAWSPADRHWARGFLQQSF